MTGLLPFSAVPQNNTSSSAIVQLSLYLVVLAIIVVLFSMSERDLARSDRALSSVAEGFDIVHLRTQDNLEETLEEHKSLVQLASEISLLLDLQLETVASEIRPADKFTIELDPQRFFVRNTSAFRHEADEDLRQISALLVDLPVARRPVMRLAFGVPSSKTLQDEAMTEGTRWALAVAERLISYGVAAPDVQIGFDAGSASGLTMTLLAKQNSLGAS